MLDFHQIAADLLGSADTLLPQWLPAGRRKGAEYVVGSLRGDEGESLKINLRTGLWKDFASGEGGKDLLALYAAIHGLKQGEAAKRLGYVNGVDYAPPASMTSPKSKPEPDTFEMPPDDAPPLPPSRHGDPTAVYAYRTIDGALVGYVARYDNADGKEFTPYRWADGKWQRKALPRPRPLYGLPHLADGPERPVLVVEGEKCVDALSPIMRRFAVVSWSGGAQAVHFADWSPLKGRNVTLWPDNDEPGSAAMTTLQAILIRAGATELRRIVPTGQPEGWDAADAVAEGWDAKRIVGWVRRDGDSFLKHVVFDPSGAESAAPQASPPHATPAPAATAPDPSTIVVAEVTDGPSSAADARLAALLSIPTAQRWNVIGINEAVMQNGRPPANEDTVHRLCEYLRGQFWFDTFLMRPMTTWRTGQSRPVDDDVLYDLTVFMQRDMAMPKMSTDRIKHGIGAYCAKVRRNVAQEWMLSLAWDGIERLPLMLPAAFGTEDDAYHAAVGRCFMVGMASRILRPGCQMDNVMLLEGGEGNGKSSALRIIGGEWFTEATESVTSKDFYQCLQGKMLVELAEMSNFERASVEKVKAVITNRVDTYRKSYGFLSGDYPRQCVFTCTTNRDDWNRSDTGARRFWRVRTGRIDLAWLASNREQLFAEAAHQAVRHAVYWDVPDHEQRRLADDARPAHPWERAVLTYAERVRDVRPEDALTDAIQLPLDRQDGRALEAVRSILRAAGYSSAVKWNAGKAARVWRKPLPSAPEPVSDATDFPDDDPEIEL